MKEGNTRRTQRGELQANGKPYPLSMSSIDQYVKAVVDLYAVQKSTSVGLINFENPRGSLLKTYLRALRQQEADRMRNSYEDRGAGTLQDGYTPDELIRVSMYYFTSATESMMRDRLVFLMQHMMLLRGESTRRMDLTDLFTLDLKDEGYSECPALVLLMREGKTNHTGRSEYAATIRHKDYKICAFGALAFYFFYRWQIMNEDFPDLSKNELWFDIKVLKGNKGITNEIDYSTQYKSVCKAFDACGINSQKKTHAGRGCGARHAEIAGASEDQLRRHGRWNAQSMENNYLTSLPRQSIRVINGFPAAGGQFWLPRASVTPSEDLQVKIFPLVDQVLSSVESGYTEGSEELSSSTYPKTICGQGFLLLLKKLRVIFLQDSVFFKVDYPTHPLFQNPLFNDPLFLEFEALLLTTCREQDSPQEMKLKEVVPEIEVVLNNMNMKLDSVSTIVNHMNSQATRSMINSSSTSNDNNLAAINASMRNIATNFNQLKSACAYFVNGSPRVDGEADVHDEEEQLAIGLNNGLTGQPSSIPVASTANVELVKYSMKPWVKTVPDHWLEFTVGLEGTPSIDELNRLYKASWRRDEKGKKYY